MCIPACPVSGVENMSEGRRLCAVRCLALLIAIAGWPRMTRMREVS